MGTVVPPTAFLHADYIAGKEWDADDGTRSGKGQIPWLGRARAPPFPVLVKRRRHFAPVTSAPTTHPKPPNLMQPTALLTPLALAALSPALSLGQANESGLTAPTSIYGLDETLEITIGNQGAFSVSRGDEDVTSSATVLSETALEDGSVRYVLDLSNVELIAGESLRVHQEGSDLIGSTHREAVIDVQNNMEIDAFAAPGEWTAGPTVQVSYREMNVDTSLFAVFYFGADVTSLVPMTAAETVELIENPDDPFAPLLRIDEFHLDFSALGGVIPPDGAIELVALGSQADATFAYEVLPLDGDFAVIEEEEDCVKDAIKDFLDAIGLEKTGDCTKASKSPDQIKAAAEQLAAKLDQCEPRMPRTPQKCTYTDSSGDEVEVIIDFDSGGDSSASGKADAVISISGSNGGDASATNKKKCGTAIAVGADGRGGVSHPGGGGNAGAKANGGPATAAAGDGGSAIPATNAGGNGGNSKATTTGPGGGSANQNGAAGGPGTRGSGGQSQSSVNNGSSPN